jgi:hypothetical protein
MDGLEINPVTKAASSKMKMTEWTKEMQKLKI